MQVLNVRNVRDKLDIILEEVQDSYEPLTIAGEKYSAVLVSEEFWRSVEETLYLTSIPGHERIYHRRYE
jgi:PHD/YefM family antitoxin component YafN of YafNO toxin-antitoxin module